MVYTKLGRTEEAEAEFAAFLVLKNKEDVMASPQEKLGENGQGKASLIRTALLIASLAACAFGAPIAAGQATPRRPG